MAFGEMKMEIPPIPERRTENRYESLQESLKTVANKLRMRGIPVHDDCRVNMDAFARPGLFSESEVKIHKSRVADYKAKDEGRLNARREALNATRDWRTASYQKPKGVERKPTGELLEEFMTVFLNKFLGDSFYIFRTSMHDDFRNHIDNLIIDKETGNIVGAFDEVADMSGKVFEEKKAKVTERNLRGGGIVQYGFEIMTIEGEQLLIPSRAKEHIPILYLALSQDMLEKAISSPDKESIENFIFTQLLISIGSQISVLKEHNLHPEFRKRLDLFESAISKQEDKIQRGL